MVLRPVRVAALLVALLVLAGCRIVPFEPDVAATFDAQVVSWPGGAPDPRASGLLLPAGRTLYFAIEFGAGRRDLLYAEVVADGPLRVSLVDARGRTLARSTSAEVFPSEASQAFFTTADGDRLAPRAISDEFTCLGPCAAVRAVQPMVYVAVENHGSVARTFDLYAFTMPFSDLNEPNDRPASATPVVGPGVASGAIETIGDVDWFVMGGSSVRELAFDAFSDALGLRLRIEGSDVLLSSGGSDVIYPGERFSVASSLGRAGPSASSGYTVEIGQAIASNFDRVVDAVDSTTPSRLLSRTIAGGATRTYLLRLPTLARDLFYVEVTADDLRVTIMTRSGVPLVASSDRAFFQTAAGDAGVDPSSVGVYFGCYGPCAAMRPSSETYLVEVRNLAPGSRSFDLYAFVMDANDENDRGSRTNDARGTATPIPGVGSYGGAIEWVGDEDWFRYTGSSELELEFTVLDENLGIELVFYGTSGAESPIRGTTDGVITGLYLGDVLRVSSGLARAGPSASSAYFLEVRTP
ncbi:MAG: hypothetical protein ACNA8N_02730 [Trueperaceae bacterium]